MSKNYKQQIGDEIRDGYCQITAEKVSMMAGINTMQILQILFIGKDSETLSILDGDCGHDPDFEKAMNEFVDRFFDWTGDDYREGWRIRFRALQWYHMDQDTHDAWVEVCSASKLPEIYNPDCYRQDVYQGRWTGTPVELIREASISIACALDETPSTEDLEHIQSQVTKLEDHIGWWQDGMRIPK